MEWKAVKNPEKTKRKPLEIYVHIPFCVKKCAYCDFLSQPASRECQEAYVQALVEEIRHTKNGKDREVVSVFWGGGTPSLLEPQWMEAILLELKDQFSFGPETEVTIEANPGTLTREKLQCYKKGGINRISLGLQSVDKDALQTLGRIHSYEEFLQSFVMAREAGFSNINVDLMCAIPGQTYEDWVRNLKTVAALEPEHISAYSLILEEGTPFYEQELDLPDEDTEYRMYEDTAGILAEYGYRQYEISNYAKEGYACRHNEGYWKRREYLGLGLGASSLYEETRYKNTTDMGEYIRNSKYPESLRREEEVLTLQEQMEEFMFLGLRMTEGISEEEFQNFFSSPLPSRYRKILEKYEAAGLMEKETDHWRFTRRGIHVSNHILAEFLE